MVLVETLAQAKAYGWVIAARCAADSQDRMKRVRECVHGYKLDLETLIWTRGELFPISGL